MPMRWQWLVNIVVLAVLVVARDSDTVERDATSSRSDNLRQSRLRSLLFFPKIDQYFGTERFIRHDGLRRWFMEFRPQKFEDNAALVIQLHWGGGNMRSSSYLGRIIEKDLWLKLSKKDGFLVLSPNGTQKRGKYLAGIFGRLNTRGNKQEWNDILGEGPAATGADDVGFLNALVDWAVRERKVDPKRVYVTGISSGGLMSYRMILERSGLFAGAAVFGSSLPFRNVTAYTVPTPVFMMSGTKDTRMPYEGRTDVSKGRGQIRPAEATRDFFVTANGAGPMVETNMPDIDPNDECTVVSQYFPSDTAPVQFFRMNGGGHVPAGITYKYMEEYLVDGLLGQTCHDVIGIEEAWSFMKQYPPAQS